MAVLSVAATATTTTTTTTAAAAAAAAATTTTSTTTATPVNLTRDPGYANVRHCDLDWQVVPGVRGVSLHRIWWMCEIAGTFNQGYLQ